MTGLLSLKTSEQVRSSLTLRQQKQIQQMYKNLAERVASEATRLRGKDGISNKLRQAYLNELLKQLKTELNSLSIELDGSIQTSMYDMADAVIDDNIKFLMDIGFANIQGAMSHVPKDVVESIISGNIYQGKWTLTKAIKNLTRATQKDIQQVIAEGVALNKSTYDIAKEIEKYIDPSQRKPWDWGKVYPGVTSKVDYNAQRLARTLISHAYQQSLVNSCSKNPFVTGFQWRSAHTHRTCEICNERDGQIYPKDELPLDHPNGLCTFLVVTPSQDEVINRLADWVNGKSDKELDEFDAYLRGKNNF